MNPDITKFNFIQRDYAEMEEVHDIVYVVELSVFDKDSLEYITLDKCRTDDIAVAFACLQNGCRLWMKSVNICP